MASFALLQRYLKQELKTPALVHAPMEERELEDKHLLQEVKLLLRDYWPHPILEFSGYISTFWSGFWAVLPAAVSPGEEQVLTLKDGGTVSLHWGEPPEDTAEDRVVLVLPGLNNDSRTSFIQDTMRHLKNGGFHGVTLNYRGVGGQHLQTPRVGCADSWRDFDEVVDHLQAKRPNATLFAMGFSMGAGMLLRYLGEEGPRVRLKAAVAVAAPVDFPAVGKSLESSLKKRGINFLMVNGVKLFMMRSLVHSPFANLLNRGAILRATSLRQLEEASICALHGYKDAEEYWTVNSPLSKLQGIAVPTLVVNAEDDPVVSISTLPLEALKQNPRVYVAITRRGGHIGWGSGGLGAAAWTDNMAVHFMQACGLRSRL